MAGFHIKMNDNTTIVLKALPLSGCVKKISIAFKRLEIGMLTDQVSKVKLQNEIILASSLRVAMFLIDRPPLYMSSSPHFYNRRKEAVYKKH